MNRFVKKERIQIGTLKALGIRKSKIIRMYVNYGLFISIIAGILGIILGNCLIGKYFLEMEMVFLMKNKSINKFSCSDSSLFLVFCSRGNDICSS